MFQGFQSVFEAMILSRVITCRLKGATVAQEAFQIVLVEVEFDMHKLDHHGDLITIGPRFLVRRRGWQ